MTNDAITHRAVVFGGIEAVKRLSRAPVDVDHSGRRRGSHRRALARSQDRRRAHDHYDPDRRREVSNLLLIAALCTGRDPADIADELGDRGAAALKALVTEAVNEELRPLRKRRRELAADPATSSRSPLTGTRAPMTSPTRPCNASARSWTWTTKGRASVPQAEPLAACRGR